MLLYQGEFSRVDSVFYPGTMTVEEMAAKLMSIEVQQRDGLFL